MIVLSNPIVFHDRSPDGAVELSSIARMTSGACACACVCAAAAVHSGRACARRFSYSLSFMDLQIHRCEPKPGQGDGRVPGRVRALSLAGCRRVVYSCRCFLTHDIMAMIIEVSSPPPFPFPVFWILFSLHKHKI